MSIEEMQKQLDEEIKIVRTIIEGALKRHLNEKVKANSKFANRLQIAEETAAQLIRLAILRLQEARLIINPEKRVSFYKEFIDGIQKDPSKNLGALFDKELGQGFSFNEKEKKALQEKGDKLTELQRELNNLQQNQSQMPSAKTELRSSENPLNKRLVLDFLENSIKQLTQAQRNKKNIFVSSYKRAKKSILSSFGKTHVSKNELLSQLQSELTNIKHAMENMENPITSIQSQEKIEESIKRIEKIKEKRVEFISRENSTLDAALNQVKSDLKLMQANVQLNKCFDDMVVYANKKHGLASNILGDILQEKKASKKYKENEVASSLANNPNALMGDFIARYYPYPVVTKNRDQLVIDTLDHYKDNPNNRDSDFYKNTFELLTDLNYVRVFRDRIISAYNSYQGTTDERFNLKSMFELYDEQTTALAEKMRHSNDPEIQKMVEPLLTTRKLLSDAIPESCRQPEMNTKKVK